jgi:hypothetical protein
MQNIGQVLDSLGLQVSLDEGELISGAIVILETIDPDGDVALQVVEDSGVSWVRKIGMLKVALAGSMDEISLRTTDNDDDS